MKKATKNLIRVFTILLLIISVAGTSSFIPAKSDKEPIKKELAEKKQGKEISKPASMIAVLPFFQFDLLQDLYLISSLDFVKDLHQKIIITPSEYQSKYFKTLFCFVISPNAP